MEDLARMLNPFLYVDLSILIIRVSPFFNLGVSGGCVHFTAFSIKNILEASELNLYV